MKKILSLICLGLMVCSGTLSNKNLQAQQYSDPYDPSAPVMGTQTGMNLLTLGAGLLVVGAVAATIIATSNGNSNAHN